MSRWIFPVVGGESVGWFQRHLRLSGLLWWAIWSLVCASWWSYLLVCHPNVRVLFFEDDEDTFVKNIGQCLPFDTANLFHFLLLWLEFFVDSGRLKVCKQWFVCRELMWSASEMHPVLRRLKTCTVVPSVLHTERLSVSVDVTPVS